MASSRPPSPTSQTATSTPARRKSSNAIAVVTSKKVGWRLQLSARQEPFHGVTQVGSRRFERRPADRLAHDDEPLRQIDQMW